MSETERVSIIGQCLCGAARYELQGRFQGLMLHCHCQRCRKHYGSIFASFVGLEDGEGAWLTGREHIETFTSGDLVDERAFCRICGSTMLRPDFPSPAYGCSAGNILEMPMPGTTYYFYLGGKVPWYQPPADSPHLYDIVHPDYRDRGLSELDRPCSKDKICGSCLCGDVTFEATNPLYLMNCHCSRCRLSRASAHATNLFVAGDDFQWKSGEAQVVNYKLPEAERFGAAFCKRCGSLVPRVRTDRVNIPAGCLDSYPELIPRGHIHVASKAPWFEIEDELPRWDSGPS